MFFDAQRRLRSMLTSWTSFADEDLFTRTSAGRSWFRPDETPFTLRRNTRYAENRLAPLCRKPNGSITPKDDSWKRICEGIAFAIWRQPICQADEPDGARGGDGCR